MKHQVSKEHKLQIRNGGASDLLDGFENLDKSALINQSDGSNSNNNNHNGASMQTIQIETLTTITTGNLNCWSHFLLPGVSPPSAGISNLSLGGGNGIMVATNTRHQVYLNKDIILIYQSCRWYVTIRSF